MKFRVLPATIAVAAVLLAIKVGDTLRSAERMVSSAAAAEGPATVPINEAAKPDVKPEEKKPEEKKAETPAEKPAENKDVKAEAPKPEEKKEEKTAEKPADKPNPPAEPKKDDKKAEEKKPEEKKAEGGEKHAEGEGKKEEPKVSLPEGKTPEDKAKEDEDAKKVGGLRPEDKRFSPEEVQIFQMLSKRRDELETWKSDMGSKEVMLAAVEKRMDQKLVEMDALKKELAALLAQYNEKEDTKVASLVKIYENMKPRDAARIFDEVEMPILLMVIDKMAEKKAAPILAAMDPKKAKQLTVELAEKRKLEHSRLTAGGMPQPFKPPATPPTPQPAPAPTK